ncbi:hypothetical protein [Rubritalea sp.]|uniref:hypothetical protein n=1 Tax=Rubritalea sp. TaxID=2109375 RepID=UPI003EF64554
MSQGRKRRHSATTRQKSGSLLKWVFGGCIILVVGGILAYKSAINFLHSVQFRETIAEKVGEKIGAPAKLGEMKWSLLHMENEGFYASSEGAIEIIEAQGIELNVASDFLTSDVWTLSDVIVQTADLKLDLTKNFTAIEPKAKEKQWIETLLPEQAEITDLSIIRANGLVTSTMGNLRVVGTALNLEKKDYGYSAELSGGRLDLPLFVITSAELDQAKLRMLNQRVVLDLAELTVMDSGRLELDGEIDFSTDALDYSVNGSLTGLKCSNLINEDWKQRLSGDVESSFSARPSADGELNLNGDVVIRDGQLTALPVLDTIAAYTAVRDFKTLRFSEFRCDFMRRGSAFRLSNIYLHCDGLMRIEGYLNFNGQAVDGVFQVGLNPGTLSHIPGAEEKVFQPGKEGMSWTTVRIGGTVDNVTEDLSDRMMVAAGERLFEMIGGKTMLKFGGTAVDSVEVLSNLPNGDVHQTLKDTTGMVIETSQDLIDSGEILSDPVKSGTDIIQSGLGGLFGVGGRDKKNEDE